METAQESRTSKAIYNYLSSIGLTAVTFLTAIISSRIILRQIGDERFGAFRTLFELFSFLNLIDIGISSSIRPLLAKAMGKGEISEIHRIMRFAYRICMNAMVIYLICGLMISFFSYRIIPVSAALTTDLKIASIVFTTGMINLLVCPNRCLCETFQKLSIVNKLLISQSIAITLSSVAITYFFPEWGISVLTICLTFWVFIFNLLLFSKTRKLSNELIGRNNETVITNISTRELLRHGRDNFILMLAGRASLQSNNLIVGYFYGQSDVTKLYATQRLFDVIQNQLFSIGNACWAALAQIYHQNLTELFKTRVQQLFQVIMVIGISVVIPVLFQNQKFINIWLGGNRYGGDFLTIALAFLTIGLGFTVFSTWCLMSTGHLQSILRLSIITAILDVSATFFFTSKIGLIGPILGSSLVLYSVAIPWHLYLLQKHFEIRWKSICFELIIPIISIPIFIAFNILINSWFKPLSLVGLAQLIVWPAITYQIIMGILIISRDDWRKIRKKIWPMKNS
jgi:O-antigen/teichoic acid export membrane protein